MQSPKEKKHLNTVGDSVWDYQGQRFEIFEQDFTEFVSRSKKQKYVVIILHINNMHSILLGHGAEISLQISVKIRDLLGELLEKKLESKEVFIHRTGADCFIFCYPQKDEKSDIIIKERLFANFKSQCYDVEGKPVYLSMSVGSDIYDSANDESIAHALNNAFVSSKWCEKNSFCKYTDIDKSKIEECRKDLEDTAYFQRVIIENKLKLAFQPVISMRTGKVKSYESLLRIMDDNGSVKSAGKYICLAERMGFIEQVDFIVLDLVAKELAANPQIRLGVNVSSISVAGDEWLEYTRELCSKHDIASRLIVELTETGMHADMDKVARFVEALQLLGCEVAIDDFGTGYTSFTQLKSLNADLIKIDGSFIRDIVNCSENQLFVKTMVNFAKSFGLRTVAEFVENGETVKELMKLGVDYMQGFYFSEATVSRPWVTEDLKD